VTSKLDSLISQTGPSNFPSFKTKKGLKDHHTQDGSSTSLVSSRHHTRPEEEDPADEGAKDEARSGQEGERRVLQHHSADDPNKERVESEGEGQHPCAQISDDDMDLLDDDVALFIKDGSPPPTDMDINMVSTLPAKFRGIEEEVAQMCLGPKEAVFEKPEESSKHLKLLYIRGHIDMKPISKMLMNGGAAILLMPYSVFKKLEREDDKLMKTNLMLNDVGGNPMEARGVISMELTVGSKSLAITFFIVEVQGKYSVILGRDWIHANRCIPSILHQFLI
jgi:hypothetical protein